MFGLLVFCILCGIVAFLIFGLPVILKIGERAGNLFSPSDASMRNIPEYSLAEARVKNGKYREAIDEYRKVLLEHPDDIYPHLRIAELSLQHLNDVPTAETELLAAVTKARGEYSASLAAGRLADFYQNVVNDPTRALAAMQQFRDKYPQSKEAARVSERIAKLEAILGGAPPAPSTPDKLSIRPSRYKMSE